MKLIIPILIILKVMTVIIELFVFKIIILPTAQFKYFVIVDR